MEGSTSWEVGSLEEVPCACLIAWKGVSQMVESFVRVYEAGIDSVWADPCRHLGGQRPSWVEAEAVDCLVHDDVVLDRRQAAMRIEADHSPVRKSVEVYYVHFDSAHCSLAEVPFAGCTHLRQTARVVHEAQQTDFVRYHRISCSDREMAILG